MSGSKQIDPALLLELFASRICHDLISPVGAVHNGVAFLEEAGSEGSADAVALISHSVQQAAARLQAFRLAYGAGGRDSNIKPDDVKKVFADLLGTEGKVKQDWDPAKACPVEMPTGYCKILAGTMMMAQECLPRGGVVRVENGGGNVTHIIAEGQDAGPRGRVEDALMRRIDPADIDPRLVHPFVLSLLAEQYGMQIQIAEKTAGRVLLKLLYTHG